jgi:hypothetical protein
MPVIHDRVPLGNHRASIARYLRGIAFPGRSVASRIIEERVPSEYVLDPIRPSLLLWACAACDGNLDDALPVAAAFDLFDRFLLLHDELANESSPIAARWGLGQSLNAGDALYALAFRSLASDVSNPPPRLEAARLVGQAVLEAIERGDGDAARDAVLTAAALKAGAVIAEAPEKLTHAFADAGRCLALRDPSGAVAGLRGVIGHDDLAVLEEVARYVARRAI